MLALASVVGGGCAGPGSWSRSTPSGPGCSSTARLGPG